MERYDYYEAVLNDVKQYIQDNNITPNDYADRDEMFDDLNDRLWLEDSVTGNGSGSYTVSTWKAEEYLCHNLELLGEVLRDFGCGPEYMMEKGPEACDVTIRCYLLSESITAALDELFPED